MSVMYAVDDKRPCVRVLLWTKGIESNRTEQRAGYQKCTVAEDPAGTLRDDASLNGRQGNWASAH